MYPNCNIATGLSYTWTELNWTYFITFMSISMSNLFIQYIKTTKTDQGALQFS